MKVVYHKDESLAEYLARMDAQDAALAAFCRRRRLIRQIVIIAIGLIVVFVIMAIR